MLSTGCCDWSLDQKIHGRQIGHRLLEKPIVWTLLAISAIGFLIASAAINRLASPAPVALVMIFFYR